MVQLSVCLASALPDHDSAQAFYQGRISDMGGGVGRLWTDLRGIVCIVLSPDGPALCTQLLDQRSALGCGTQCGEFYCNAGAGEAALPAAEAAKSEVLSN